jgi:hypothetical protein
MVAGVFIKGDGYAKDDEDKDERFITVVVNS